MTEQYFFHPDYDSRVHVDYTKLNSIGTAFIGVMGLLSRLELKAGLVHAEIPNEDCAREQEYRDAIKNSSKSLKCFKSSFDLDEINSTRQILCWRDVMKMACWDFKTFDNCSDVLADLSVIESNYKNSFLGIADRWIAVKEYIANSQIPISITACCEKNQIHPTILYILEKLNAKFVPYSDENGGVLTSYKFKDAFDAYQAAALTLDPQKDILVTQNANMLNEALVKAGHAEIDASLEDNFSPLVQLFRITLLMFAEPRNFRNIVSYLLTSPCPILCGNRLGDYLLEHCGWGDENAWNNFISEVQNFTKWDDASNTSVPYTPSEIQDIQNGFNDFKTFIGSIRPNASGTDIKSKISDLIAWTNSTRAGQIISIQKANLRNICRRLFILLDEKKSYTPDEIKSLADSINTSSSVPVASSRVESFYTYPSFGCIYDSVSDGKVVWIDCYGELAASYDYSFLPPSDAAALQRKGVGIWSKTEQVAAKIALMSAAAKHAGTDVVLFIPQNSDGSRVALSPLVAELGIDMAKVGPYSLKVSANTVVPFASNPKTDYYDLKVAVPQRPHESYSSLNMLINTPFDYVLQYACGLYAPEVDQLDGLDRICGSVAHKAFENMCKASGNNTANVKAIVSDPTLLGAEIDKAASECGIVLLLPENSFRLNNLKSDLQVSFSNLIDIIINNNLQIVGNEMNYKEASSSIIQNNELTAQIDLVLKNKAGEICVFDLKYGKPKYYRDKLVEDKALQLDIYRYCVEHDTYGLQSQVAMVGYFNLKVGRLFTTYPNFSPSGNIDVVNCKNTLSNVMDLVRSSYDFRFDEFNSKHQLEEGEGCPTASLTYFSSSLYPQSEKSGNKSQSRFSKHTLFKGGSK